VPLPVPISMTDVAWLAAASIRSAGPVPWPTGEMPSSPPRSRAFSWTSFSGTNSSA